MLRAQTIDSAKITRAKKKIIPRKNLTFRSMARVIVSLGGLRREFCSGDKIIISSVLPCVFS